MLTILVPVDFSECSVSAASYAVKMAEKADEAILIFLHIPEYETEGLSEEEQEDLFWELQQKEYKNFTAFENTIFPNPAAPGLSIDYKYKIGSKVQDIVAFANEAKADVIIMGMRGKNSLSEKVFGSVATHVIENAQVPVLVVPQNAEYKSIDKIVLAYDDGNDISDKVIEKLKFYTNFFGAKLHVIKVFEFVNSPEKAQELLNLDRDLFGGLNYSCAVVLNDDVIFGIDEYVKAEQAGMVIMLERNHSAWHKVFSGSIINKTVFHVHVPILVLPSIPISSIVRTL